MPTSRYYVDIASRHQVYLERLKAGYINNYEREIRKIDRAIRGLIQELKVESMNELTRKQFSELLREMRETQLVVYQNHTGKLIDDLSQLATAEAAFELQAFRRVARGRQFREAANAWSMAINNPIQATGEMLDPFVRGLTTRQAARIEREMRISRSQGRTISQTVTAIRGTKRNHYRDGVIQKNWNDARTVVRTATQHVSSQGRMATWQANRDVLEEYQWVSTLDGVTSDTCMGLDGQVFRIGRGPLPPIHPNCRSTTVPFFRDGVDLFDTDATRSSETGPVKSDMTYYEWLKTQPKNFQDDAIGPVRAKLLREGGLSATQFRDLSLDKNFKPLTLNQMRDLNPHAFEMANI